ncbi:MAG: AAA family ATPase [Verrucomicrobiae bacterium]|nr:AAA family ATPase [Verrucomicrobiae bacterium]
MQEHRVTVGNRTLSLEEPFFRVGDAEPDRAGGQVSVAGSAARAGHVQHLGGLSRRV